jgi:hypothetical protein
MDAVDNMSQTALMHAALHVRCGCLAQQERSCPLGASSNNLGVGVWKDAAEAAEHLLPHGGAQQEYVNHYNHRGYNALHVSAMLVGVGWARQLSHLIHAPPPSLSFFVSSLS